MAVQLSGNKQTQVTSINDDKEIFKLFKPMEFSNHFFFCSGRVAKFLPECATFCQSQADIFRAGGTGTQTSRRADLGRHCSDKKKSFDKLEKKKCSTLLIYHSVMSCLGRHFFPSRPLQCHDGRSTVTVESESRSKFQTSTRTRARDL